MGGGLLGMTSIEVVNLSCVLAYLLIILQMVLPNRPISCVFTD